MLVWSLCVEWGMNESMGLLVTTEGYQTLAIVRVSFRVPKSAGPGGQPPFISREPEGQEASSMRSNNLKEIVCGFRS